MTAARLAPRHDTSPRKPRNVNHGLHLPDPPVVPISPPVPVPTPPQPLGPVDIPPAPPGPLLAEDVVEALAAMLAERDAAVEAMTLTIGELRADNVAIHERLDRLFAPEQPPSGFLALKVAASLAGCSGEHLRQLCVAGKVDAHRIGSRWFIDVATLESCNGLRGGKDES